MGKCRCDNLLIGGRVGHIKSGEPTLVALPHFQVVDRMVCYAKRSLFCCSAEQVEIALLI
jgi:hypothetical protein